LAGWIQTPAFVKAQLSHPNITWRGGCKIVRLHRANSQWQAIGPDGQSLAESQHLILANAHQCQALLDTAACAEDTKDIQRPALPATALRGQVTFGNMSMLPPHLLEKIPAFPVNGHGSYIGNLQSLRDPSTDNFWIVGSSFQRNNFDLTCRQADLKGNLQQWAELMPALAQDIQQIDQTQCMSWAAIRSALPDRVPAVGEFQHPDFQGLQICTGMGARGISWSVLCGELLAAHLNHEPLPMAASLAKLMAANRFG
jgi:tRNA 5-methylaminomethyl-2-thiouridine biosynthesis bifunctional protein